MLSSSGISTTLKVSAPYGSLAQDRNGSQWSPYVDNGGTAMALAGLDYCIVAADTRMSIGYNILSRNQPKCAVLTEKCVLASCGMQADRDSFQKRIHAMCVQYEMDHGSPMNTNAVSRLVSTHLYYRRFFPIYTFNLVAGLDEEGRGAVYSYDAIGSFQRVPYGVQGSGSALGTSLFDNQVECETHPQNKKDLNLEEGLALVKDAFTSIGERDIYTGDGVDIFIITKDGVRHEQFQLKAD